MSLSLSVADWMTEVQLIYRLNCIDEYMQFQPKMLDLIKMIVPFNTGIFNLADLQQDNIIAGRLSGIGLSAGDLNELTRGLNHNAFFRSLLLDPSGVVSRGPDLLQFDGIRLNLENQRLIPRDDQHALSVVLNYKDELQGYIILFREDGEAQFSMRDKCVLDNLKMHIALQLYKLSCAHADRNHPDNRVLELNKKLSQYGLSKRELEILELLQRGKSDLEICEKLFFATSTFKKHLNHIYGKMKVNNRVMLLKLMESEMQ